MKLSDLARRMIIIILITAFACVLISVVYYRFSKVSAIYDRSLVRYGSKYF